MDNLTLENFPMKNGKIDLSSFEKPIPHLLSKNELIEKIKTLNTNNDDENTKIIKQSINQLYNFINKDDTNTLSNKTKLKLKEIWYKQNKYDDQQINYFINNKLLDSFSNLQKDYNKKIINDPYFNFNSQLSFKFELNNKKDIMMMLTVLEELIPNIIILNAYNYIDYDYSLYLIAKNMFDIKNTNKKYTSIKNTFIIDQLKHLILLTNCHYESAYINDVKSDKNSKLLSLFIYYLKYLDYSEIFIQELFNNKKLQLTTDFDLKILFDKCMKDTDELTIIELIKNFVNSIMKLPISFCFDYVSCYICIMLTANLIEKIFYLNDEKQLHWSNDSCNKLFSIFVLYIYNTFKEYYNGVLRVLESKQFEGKNKLVQRYYLYHSTSGIQAQYIMSLSNNFLCLD